MATTRKPQPQKERAKLLVPRAEFDGQLAERIKLGEELLGIEMQTPSAYEEVHGQYRRWDEYNATLIESAFTTSEEADTYQWWGIAVSSDNIQAKIAYLTKDIKEKVHRLESLKERLSLFPEVSAPAVPTMLTKPVSTEQAVFIVHGRDEGSKHKVARLVQDVTGLRPNAVVLGGL